MKLTLASVLALTSLTLAATTKTCTNERLCCSLILLGDKTGLDCQPKLFSGTGDSTCTGTTDADICCKSHTVDGKLWQGVSCNSMKLMPRTGLDIITTSCGDDTTGLCCDDDLVDGSVGKCGTAYEDGKEFECTRGGTFDYIPVCCEATEYNFKLFGYSGKKCKPAGAASDSKGSADSGASKPSTVIAGQTQTASAGGSSTKDSTTSSSTGTATSSGSDTEKTAAGDDDAAFVIGEKLDEKKDSAGGREGVSIGLLAAAGLVALMV